MNNWELTIQRFCAIGGEVNNVQLGEGPFGRGLFSQNPNLPVKICVPPKLLCPIDWLQLDAEGGLMLTQDCNWTADIKSFFLDYQRDYGIGSNLMQQMMQKQLELHHLPESTKIMLAGFGMSKSLFDKPNLELCLDRYKNSRRILFKNSLVLMPLLEMVNHDENSKKSFNKTKNISVSGCFKDEILVHYDMVADAALMFEGYGFTTPKPYTFSGSISINLGIKTIKISRFVNLYKTIKNTNIPQLKVEGNTIHLSCLVLGSMNDKNSPKKIFTNLMSAVEMPADMASNVFDGIVEQNKNFFLHLLEELKPLQGGVIEGLRTMAKNQLIPLGVKI